MEKNYGGYDLEEAEYYDVIYDITSGKNRGNDVPFYISYSAGSGGRTLELGCGTGRVLIPTAVAGCCITGLDLSPFMLDVCRQKLARQPANVQERVRILQDDMTRFRTGETYSLVTIPFRAFQHLITVEEQKACLKCIREHLETDGKLIIDIYNPNPARLYPNPAYAEEKEDFPEQELPDGRRVRRTNLVTGFHRHEQYNDCHLIYYVTYPGGRQERLVQQFPMRYLFRYELEHLLELCGFRLVELFGNYDRSPYADDSPEIIAVAEKA